MLLTSIQTHPYLVEHESNHTKSGCFLSPCHCKRSDAISDYSALTVGIAASRRSSQ